MFYRIFQLQTCRFIAILLSVMLLSCADNAKQATQFLKAIAGPDIRVQAGEGFVLDAGKSTSGNSISYTWDLMSGPSEPVIFKGTLRHPHEELTAPSVTEETKWVVQLSIHDGTNTAVDQIEITVIPLPEFALSVHANPENAGIVTGGNSYSLGSNVTINAISNDGYAFVNWTEGDTVISSSLSYSLIVTAEHMLIANFVARGVGPKLELQNGDGQVTLSWAADPLVNYYNIYYAQSPGVTAENYDTLKGGTRLLNVYSPTTVSGLSNGTDYFFIITSVTNDIESVRSIQVGAQPRYLQPKRPRLNDTGIVLCAGADPSGQPINGLPCPQSAYPNQDGESGRDTDEMLAKIGGGIAGFDFSKIGMDGLVLANDSSAWNCVRDNVTGMWWEVKTNNGGKHQWDVTYTWSDIGAFKAEVNKEGLCGYGDWRLPTRDELRTIVNYNILRHTVDEGYFPNTGTGEYWTSTSYAADETYAWCVSFYAGYDPLRHKTSSLNVRLVRAGL